MPFDKVFGNNIAESLPKFKGGILFFGLSCEQAG